MEFTAETGFGLQKRRRFNQNGLKNSCSAPAAARIGQAEVATIIAKSNISAANSKPLSFAK
jgi:hypothetical protein